MKRKATWLIVVLMSMLALSTARAADSVQLEDTLPPDTLALVSCRDINGSWKRFMKTREKARSNQSMNHLRELYMAVTWYVNDHDGKLPPRDKFPVVLNDYIDNKKVFYHPSREDAVKNYPDDIDYVFPSHLPNTLRNVNPDIPIMWERRSFKSNGSRMVLFRDGRVERVSRQKFKKLMRKAKKMRKKK